MRTDASCSGFSSEAGGQFFICITAMADGYETDHTRSAIDSINDSKAADTILPQPVEFALKQAPSLGVSCKGVSSSFDRVFQLWMERLNDLSYMRRDIRAEGTHAVRHFSFIVGALRARTVCENAAHQGR